MNNTTAAHVHTLDCDTKVVRTVRDGVTTDSVEFACQDTTAATTALIIALNDAKLEVTSRNRDSILADLIKVAQANGRTDVAHTLGVIAVDQRADVPAALATLVLDLYAAEVPQAVTAAPTVVAYDSEAYRKGWAAALRMTGDGSALDRADARRAPQEWYDGYHDAAEGREKYARRDERLA